MVEARISPAEALITKVNNNFLVGGKKEPKSQKDQKQAKVWKIFWLSMDFI
jgi:hypothetical protein